MLYQKGTQRIEVIVRKEGGGGMVGAKERSTEEASSSESKEGNGKYSAIFGTSSEARKRRIIKTNTTHMLAVSQHFALMYMNYHYSGYSYYYGDTANQENVQRQLEIGRDWLSIGSSFAMGALYGSWGGPIGAVLGSLTNGFTAVSSVVFKYRSRDRDFSYKVFKENNAIEYARARASISLTTGRLR